MLTFITSYNRPKSLMRIVSEVDSVVIDDGSDFDPKPFLDKCEFHRLEHGGKPYFWNTYQYIFHRAKDSDASHFA